MIRFMPRTLCQAPTPAWRHQSPTRRRPARSVRGASMSDLESEDPLRAISAPHGFATATTVVWCSERIA